MSLSSVNNGDSGSSARSKINAGLSATDTNTTNIATNTSDISTNTSDISTNASTMNSHIANTSNPHSTTKTQVGLGNCDNTSDANKPVSTAQAAAIALKQTASAVSTLLTRIVQIATSYTITATDKNCLFWYNGAGYDNLTIPPTSTIPTMSFGSRIELFNDTASAGPLIVAAGSGVTIQSVGGSLSLSPSDYGLLIYLDTNNWLLVIN